MDGLSSCAFSLFRFVPFVLLAAGFLDFYKDFLCVLCLLAAPLSGKLVQLFHSDAMCAEDSGDGVASTGGEDIAMRTRDLLDEMVGAKHSQQA